MIFCEDRRSMPSLAWSDIEATGAVSMARKADLIVEMKPCGFVYVKKDRFGKNGLRSIW